MDTRPPGEAYLNMAACVPSTVPLADATSGILPQTTVSSTAAVAAPLASATTTSALTQPTATTQPLTVVAPTHPLNVSLPVPMPVAAPADSSAAMQAIMQQRTLLQQQQEQQMASMQHMMRVKHQQEQAQLLSQQQSQFLASQNPPQQSPAPPPPSSFAPYQPMMMQPSPTSALSMPHATYPMYSPSSAFQPPQPQPYYAATQPPTGMMYTPVPPSLHSPMPQLHSPIPQLHPTYLSHPASMPISLSSPMPPSYPISTATSSFHPVGPSLASSVAPTGLYAPTPSPLTPSRNSIMMRHHMAPPAVMATHLLHPPPSVMTPVSTLSSPTPLLIQTPTTVATATATDADARDTLHRLIEAAEGESHTGAFLEVPLSRGDKSPLRITKRKSTNSLSSLPHKHKSRKLVRSSSAKTISSKSTHSTKRRAALDSDEDSQEEEEEEEDDADEDEVEQDMKEGEEVRSSQSDATDDDDESVESAPARPGASLLQRSELACGSIRAQPGAKQLRFRSVIRCGTIDRHGNSQLNLHLPYFQREMDVYTAESDVRQRPLVRASTLAERFACATNKVGMYLARRRTVMDGIYQATEFTQKPAGKTGLKVGGYFLTLEACQDFERHYWEFKEKKEGTSKESQAAAAAARQRTKPRSNVKTATVVATPTNKVASAPRGAVRRNKKTSEGESDISDSAASSQEDAVESPKDQDATDDDEADEEEVVEAEGEVDESSPISRAQVDVKPQTPLNERRIVSKDLPTMTPPKASSSTEDKETHLAWPTSAERLAVVKSESGSTSPSVVSSLALIQQQRVSPPLPSLAASSSVFSFLRAPASATTPLLARPAATVGLYGRSVKV